MAELARRGVIGHGGASEIKERPGGRAGSQKARRLSEEAVRQSEHPRGAEDGDAAEIFIGEDDAGELTVDEEEGERSYNFRMVIMLGQDPSIQPVPALNAYLRRKFDNENFAW